MNLHSALDQIEFRFPQGDFHASCHLTAGCIVFPTPDNLKVDFVAIREDTTAETLEAGVHNDQAESKGPNLAPEKNFAEKTISAMDTAPLPTVQLPASKSNLFQVIRANGYRYEPINPTPQPGFSNMTEQLCYAGMRLTAGVKTYYYYPTTGKWRLEGRSTFYRSKSIEDLFRILGDHAPTNYHAGDLVMPWGKYSGTLLSDLALGDTQYLRWVLTNRKLPKTLREAIQGALCTQE